MRDLKKSVLTLLLLPCICVGQMEQKTSEYYNWFDQIVGQENIGLYNGKQYVNLYLNKTFDNKHQFFRSEKLLKGSVTYDGQTYYDMNMMYDLDTDNLIVTLKSGSVASFLQLIRSKVNEFTIDGSRFVYFDGFAENSTAVNGFYEVLLENNSLSLLKKHKKNKKRRLEELDGNRAYYEFVDAYEYLLFAGGEYKNIESRSDIIKRYPNLKKEIKTFYNKNKKLKKNQPDIFLKKLFESVVSGGQYL